MDETILFRIPFTLYFVGFEHLETSSGRIRYKRFLCLYRKSFIEFDTNEQTDNGYWKYIKI